MKSRVRALAGFVGSAAVVVGLMGCTTANEPLGTVSGNALCSQWEWNPDWTDTRNFEAFKDVTFSAERGHGTVELLRRAYRAGQDVCGVFHFAEVDAYFRETGTYFALGDYPDRRQLAREARQAAREAEEPATPTPEPAAAPTAPSGGSDSGSDDESDDEGPAALGLSERDVSLLAYYASEYGYGDGYDLMDEAEARRFVRVAVAACERVQSGQMTWSGMIADDISAGAPASDARRFHQYLARTFCPNLR